MKRETKLWLRSIVHRCALAARKKALMALRSIVWHMDEWIQRQEVALREEIENRGVAPLIPELSGRMVKAGPKTARLTKPFITPEPKEPGVAQTIRRSLHETFEQWEMRKAGVRPVPKHLHHRRHRPTATEFDREIAQRAKEYVQ